jgi:CRP/FNR family transcriptional regulator
MLSSESLNTFFKNATSHRYPKGATIFTQEQPSSGIYLLESGRVKLLAYSPEGKAIIVRIAEPTDVLGLSACIAGLPYEVSALVSANCRVRYVRREDFLAVLRTDQEAALEVIRELSLLYHDANYQICSLGLSTSAADKLARLFLQWSDRTIPVNSKTGSIPMNFTHEEIAEMIGTSRETVTRLIKAFKSRELIRLEGSRLIIPNKAGLRAAIGSKTTNVTILTAAR